MVKSRRSLRSLRSVWEGRFHSGMRQLTRVSGGVPMHSLNARPLITSMVLPDATIRVDRGDLLRHIDASLRGGEKRSYRAALKRAAAGNLNSPKNRAEALAMVVHGMRDIARSDKVVLASPKLRRAVFSFIQRVAERDSLRVVPGGASAYMLSAFGGWRLGGGMRPVYHGPFVPYLEKEGGERELFLPESDFLHIDGRGRARLIPYEDLAEGRLPRGLEARIWHPSQANISIQFRTPEGRDERLILQNPANTADQAIGLSRGNRVLPTADRALRDFSAFFPNALQRTRRGDIPTVSEQMGRAIRPISMEVCGTRENGKRLFRRANHLGLNEKELSLLLDREVDITDPASLMGAVRTMFSKSDRLEAITLHTEHGQLKVLRDSIGDRITARGILASGVPSTALGLFYAFPEEGRPTKGAKPSAMQSDLRHIRRFNEHLTDSGMSPIDPSATMFHDAGEGLYVSYVPKAVFKRNGRAVRAKAATGAGDTTGLMNGIVVGEGVRKGRLRGYI